MIKRALIVIILSITLSFICNDRFFQLEEAIYSIENSHGDTTKSNLFFMKNLLKDKKIVLLGEGLHNYSTDGISKLETIKFLHEEMGFNVILMEYSFYDLYELNNVIGKCGNFDDTLSKYFGKYIPKHIYDIFKYVHDCKLNGQNLVLGGVDINTSYSSVRRNPFFFLPKNDSLYNKDEELKLLYNTLQIPHSYLNVKEKKRKKEALEYVKNKTDKELFFHNDSLNKLWSQIFKNYSCEYHYDTSFTKLNVIDKLKSKSKQNYILMIDDSRKRDSIMADNFSYLRKQYTNEKVIVFASSFHIRKSTNPFIDMKVIGNETKPLGEYIFENYDDTYHIAWIYNKVGKIKGFNKSNKTFYDRSNKSIEHFLYEKKYGSVYIDIQKLKNNGDSVFVMYPIWKFKTKGNWIEAFDAVMYSDSSLAISDYYDYGIYRDTNEIMYYQ